MREGAVEGEGGKGVHMGKLGFLNRGEGWVL